MSKGLLAVVIVVLILALGVPLAGRALKEKEETTTMSAASEPVPPAANAPAPSTTLAPAQDEQAQVSAAMQALADEAAKSKQEPGQGPARVQSNESAAIGNLRTFVGAQVAFCSAHGVYGSFAMLTGTKPAFLEPSSFVSNPDGTVSKNGYIYTITNAGPLFTATAVPMIPGETGVRSFFTDQSGVIRFSADGTVATVASPPIGS